VKGLLWVKFNSYFKGDVCIHICSVCGKLSASVRHIQSVFISIFPHSAASLLLSAYMPVQVFLSIKSDGMFTCYILFLMIYIINFNGAHEVKKLQFMYLKKSCNNIRAQEVKICCCTDWWRVRD
jgi:hypothetical protein